MKVVLVTSFEDYFVEQDTLPELTRRGIEVVSRFEAKACARYDFETFKASGVTLILHMNEVGAHSASAKLSQMARDAGIPIRALSRKKASWTFLPAPLDNGPESLPKPPEERLLRPRTHSQGFAVAATLADVNANRDEEPGPLDLPDGGQLHANIGDDTAAVPEKVRTHIITTRFDRKQARLRDIVRLVVAHGITDYARVFEAVSAGRATGVFPRLIRQKADDLPKLVRSMLAHELSEMSGTHHDLHLFKEDQPAFASIGLGTVPAGAYTVSVDAAKVALDEEDTMTSGKVVPMTKTTEATADDRARLEARIAELEKLEQAHAALRNLVKLGYMTALEAAAKLFPEAP